jgi:hypothetical protein
MKKTAIFIALILVLAIAFSGCLGKGGSSSNAGSYPGIKLTGFRSEFGEVDAGEPTLVALEFDNRGDYDAENVEAKLIRKGAFSDSDMESYTSTMGNAVIEKPLNDVYSGDEFYWYLVAPGVSQDRVGEVQARLSYDYKSDAYATIHFVPQQMLRDQGEGAFQMYEYSSNSPVGIDLEVNQPVVIRNEDPKRVRINLVFANQGNGQVKANELPDGKLQCTTVEGCIDSVTVDTIGESCLIDAAKTYYCCRQSEDNSLHLWKTGYCNNAAGNQCEITGEKVTCIQKCAAEGLIGEYVGSYAGGAIEDTYRCECTGGSESLSLTLPGIKLIQGDQGRYTISENFIVSNANAATSCQLHVQAKYRYEVDSDVLPISIVTYDD